ncbi:nuclear transport factor 2 family protein [Microbulbifer sp. SAOS-129_SWC]|uniref:nuclear transport factor 2 family protein n=1 Tax=Microbulbifer sp. SAOS-129_SWC TaxID=3145235 RepID=UPI0032167AF4
MSGLIGELQQYYEEYLAADPAMLGHFYQDDVVFRDPLHQIEGLGALQRYFAAMREDLLECRFEFSPGVIGDTSACLPWDMHYAHRRLNGGALLTLRGCSLLQFGQRIRYHEDFYDLGAMVYERIPVVGALVRGIKNRLTGE